MAVLRALLVLTIATIAFYLAAAPMFDTGRVAVSGISFSNPVTRVGPLIVKHVERGSPAAKAGIEPGDVINCVSTRDRDILSGKFAFRPGKAVSMCAERNGNRRSVSFVPRLGGQVDFGYRGLQGKLLRLCVVVVFYIIGIALVLVKPNLTTWLLYGICISSIPVYAAQVMSTTYSTTGFLMFDVGVAILNAFGTPLTLLFAIVVPHSGVPRGWRRIAFIGASLLTAVYLVREAGTFVYPSLNWPSSYPLENFTAILTVLVVIARILTAEPDERARFGWAACAIVIGVVTNDLRNVLSFSNEQLSVWFAYATVLMPLILTYAILRRHVIDVRFAISRTLVYAVLTTFIVAVIGIVDWLTAQYLHEARAAQAIDAAVTIGIALVLHRTYKWIEEAIDLVLFRKKHDAEKYLQRLANTLLRAGRIDTIDEGLVHAPYEKFDLTMAALFRQTLDGYILADGAGWIASGEGFDSEDELVRFLLTERTRLFIGDLRKHVAERFRHDGTIPALAIPLFEGAVLRAFAVYGIHRDGSQLDPDEITVLEHLCALGAQAYTSLELERYRQLSLSPALAQ